MYYVYILFFPDINKYYTGRTRNLKRRLSEHKSRERKIVRDLGRFTLSFIAIFADEIVAVRFEKYLKTCSGRAFRNKRLI